MEMKLDGFVKQGLRLIRDFPVSWFAFPGYHTKWLENPRSIPGRISNDILYWLKTQPEEKRRIGLEGIYTFCNPDAQGLSLETWDRLLRDSGSPFYEKEFAEQPGTGRKSKPDSSAFLFLLLIVCSRMQIDCLQHLAQREVKDWDRPAKQ